MNRSNGEKRRQILEAAVKVFARDGYAKATIKKISTEAEVKSPALIYWYFENKQALFQAVIREFNHSLAHTRHFEELVELPAEDVLYAIGFEFIDTWDSPEMSQLLRIILLEVVHDPEVFDELVGHNILPVVDVLMRYFQYQVECGNFRSCDVNVAIRLFFGTMVSYILSREIISKNYILPNPVDYMKTTIDIILRGVIPR
ncbi:MAG: TetR/AcrR family transcriptional regulator [bacterium]|nr:TetR/AcrR family transcriptional regulator [bacterium]